MSTIRTNSVRRRNYDHFEPEMSDDPQVQKRMRAQLEQIDYTAFAANREAVGHDIGALDTDKVQRLAVAAAHARAAWVRKAMSLSDNAVLPTAAQIDELLIARMTFEELTAAYDGMRRLVERGYVTFTTLSPR